MVRTLFFILLPLFLMDASTLSACTSVIISGKCTADGRPLMWKNRDTDVLDNRLEHFSGKKYSFTALVNASSREADEVWIGMNDRGFAVMNTASYNLKDDDVPVSEMDREGILMYDALGECADVDDFEAFLDSRSRPMGVEANFGVIDSFGGAAYYEVSNDKWVKFDVNDATVCPEGYMVVTNFSRSGRPEDYRGYERYLTAEAIFREIFSFGEPCAVTPEMIFDELSRSYRSEMTGDYFRIISVLHSLAKYMYNIFSISILSQRELSYLFQYIVNVIGVPNKSIVCPIIHIFKITVSREKNNIKYRQAGQLFRLFTKCLYMPGILHNRIVETILFFSIIQHLSPISLLLIAEKPSAIIFHLYGK